jgi:hypothetical protein
MLKKGFLMVPNDFLNSHLLEDKDLLMTYMQLAANAFVHTGVVTMSLREVGRRSKIDHHTFLRKIEILVSNGVVSIERGGNQHTPTKITLLKYFEFRSKNGAPPDAPPDAPPNGPPDAPANKFATYQNNINIDNDYYSGAPPDAPTRCTSECPPDAPPDGCSILDKKKIKKKNKEKDTENRIICDGGATASEVHSIDPKATAKTAGSRVFLAYSESYQAAYGQEPVRNAKQNAHCARIVARLGEEAALETTRYYLTHRKKWYVDSGHCLAALEKDCEALDVQRRKGEMMTETLSRQIDQGSALSEVMRRVVAKYSKQETN